MFNSNYCIILLIRLYTKNLNRSILVQCKVTFCLNTCLNSLRHTFNKLMTFDYLKLIPGSQYYCLQFCDCSGRFLSYNVSYSIPYCYYILVWTT